MSQAINATYYRDLVNYEAQLQATASAKLVFTLEVAKVLSIRKGNGQSR